MKYEVSINSKKRLINKCNSNENKKSKKYKEYMDKIKPKKINISFIERIYLFISIFRIFHILSKELMVIHYKYSYITLTIDGTGEKRVFYERDNIERCHAFVYPDEVYINNVNQSEIAFKYNFNESRNTVKLVWNKEVTAITCMFYRCSDIKEIDFSHFNFSSISGDIGGTFNNCTSLISLDLSNISIPITYIHYLFYDCHSLTSIDLSNFNTSNITDTLYMFYNCYSLKSINLSSFKTPKLLDTRYMFQNCINLTSVDISNFDLTKANNIGAMFINCRSLITVIFPNSQTPNLENIGSIFRDCISLVSVDLSNFTTSKVKNMDRMFLNCKSLTFINLSNFDTSSATRVDSMFQGCSNLQYINLQNAIKTNDTQYNYINVFRGTPENLVICINETNVPELAQLIKEKDPTCYRIDCSNDWKSIQKKIINGANNCNKCSNNEEYKYELDGICQSTCQYGIFFDEKDSIQKCKCEFNKCYSCQVNIEPAENLCISCNESFYPKENDTTNLGPYINCYKEPLGYFLDKSNESNYIYKLCDDGIPECKLNESYLTGKSYITLKVKGSGINSIFYGKIIREVCSSFIPPDEVVINNYRQGYVHYEYDFKNNNNDVILIWRQTVTHLRCAFWDCTNITYIDLSHFNSSSIVHMGAMFKFCSSLKTVNFSNFITKNVHHMDDTFEGCSSLISLDLSGFETSAVKAVNGMFLNCSNLKYINLINFEENVIQNYEDIFKGIPNNITVCINKTKAPILYQLIENLNDSYIDCSYNWYLRPKEIKNEYNYSYITLRVKGIGINKIFYGKDTDYYCGKFMPPNEVYINNANQSYIDYKYNFTKEDNEVKLVWYNHINYLGCIFYKCSNITYIDFSHFNSSFVEEIHDMFYGCSSLAYVNFTNFDTSNVVDMRYMFNGCTSLISLNLSNFNTSLVNDMKKMFYNCNNLQYINLKNFEQKSNLHYPNIFNGIPKNVIVCIDEDKAHDLYHLIENFNCYNIDCSDDWYENQKKLINGKDECIENCKNHQNYKYELNNRCYNTCTHGIFNDERCKCENENCLLCSDLNPIKHLCISCNESFYPKENDPTNIGPYIICYKDPLGYYLDKSDDNYIYKLCNVDIPECKINETYLVGKSYITLKIKRKGINSVFNGQDIHEFYTVFIPPDEVIINNYRQGYVHYEYNFKNDSNDVILIWRQKITHLRWAFWGCVNITHIDFSHFDSSSLIHMGGMVQFCASLKTVNFSNFNTKTVEYIDYIFADCVSLISVDLSSFETSGIVDMEAMFYNCTSLQYINLKNFEENATLNYEYIFKEISNNITVCINETKAPNLYQLIKNLNDSYIDCSDDWKLRPKVIKNEYNYSYITLRVKGIGINRIFYAKDNEKYCSKFIPPNEVYINNANQSYIDYKYNFTKEDNEVKLVWYNHINYLGCIFFKCSNITYIDFSHFNSSFVLRMGNMFNGCSSLVNVNFTNFDTSNAENMHYMFNGCTSLISVDLSNFNTSKVKTIERMFYNCINLQYINLSNFQLKSNIYYPNIIYKVPKNLIVCIYEDKAHDLYHKIENLNCSNIYCSDDWYKNQKKIINGNDECIDNCKDDHKYELNNKCYNTCSYDSFYDGKNNVERCKCQNENCSICSDLDSIKHLCISCNESFYPKENDPTNLGPYINCYKDPLGYYLDKSDKNNYIYKLCNVDIPECKINETYLIGKSYITLKVKGKGINRVFYAKDRTFGQDFIPPDEVVINNYRQGYLHYEYDFKEEKNNEAVLIWHNSGDYLHSAFYKCSNITHIDLSHYNTSSLTNIGGLFQYCSSLVYINFTNINTLNIINMDYMFRDCTSLTTLDLIKFRTSSVINMKYMFLNCNKLRFLNLRNFEQNAKLNYTDIFNGVPNNITVCINKNKAPNLYQLIKNLNDSYIECSDLWSIRNKPIPIINTYEYNYIILRVKGIGINKIFYGKDYEETCGNFIPPDEVYINNISKSDINYEYEFTQEDNVVKLVWHNLMNNLRCMFYRCSNITFIDFSHFNSSFVIQMADMFGGCSSLTYLNFTNFDTSKAIRMHYMFNGCTSLLSLDLSNFNTSLVANMEKMFYNCINLQYINLSNFEQKNGLVFPNIFYGIPKNVIVCIKENKAPDLYKLIRDLNCDNIYCSDDWYIKQKKLNTKTSECIANCKDAQKYKYELNNRCYNTCTYGILNNERCKCENENCSICSDLDSIKNLCISCNESFYPKENDPINLGPYINCYKELPGYYLDKSDESKYIYKLCYERCKTCRIKGDEKNNNCLECSTEYSFGLPNNNYLNCYKNCSYYYYFDDQGQYTCTSDASCPLEYSKLNTNNSQCIKNCSLNDINKYEFRNKCYSKCPEESEESKTKKNYCEALCNEKNSFVIISTQECVEYCDIFSTAAKTCVLKYVTETKEENAENTDEENNNKDNKDLEEEKRAQEIKAQDKILESIEKGFTSENYDTSDLEKGNDAVIEDKKMTITLSTTDNQKNNINDNSTKVDLGECETLLRKAYHIPEDKKLYMKKIDVIQEGMKIPKVEYDVYCKLNGSNLVKLNLSHCQNIKVDLSVPVVITESLDKLNSSSGYYNDVCYTSTSDSGTDIILKDRKNEFVEGNKTVCQDGCDFSGYDYNTQKAKCSCEVKESSASSALMNINKTKLYENFIDIKNIANINLLKCYNVLFSKNGIIHNIGSFTIIPIILLHIICFFSFYCKKLGVIKDKIKDIIYGIKNMKLVRAQERAQKKKEQKEKERLEKERKEREEQIKKFEKKKTKGNNNIIEDDKNKENNEKDSKEIKNESKQIFKILPPIYLSYKKYIPESELIDDESSYSNPPKKKNQKIVINNNILQPNKNKDKKNKIKINNNINEIITEDNTKRKQLTKKETIIKKTKAIMAYRDVELNELSYELALKHDKRSYCEYYLSLIRTKHNLIFSFYYTNDYNSRIIKIDLFFISFVIYYTVNALFFNDDTMHKIYEDKGEYQFVYQLPQILYSSIISAILNALLKILALSEGDILELKKTKSKKNLKQKNNELNSKLQIKFILYFIISTILILFFWYYISMFCAIYRNTQTHLIKDTLISFGLSMFYPLGIYLVPGIFRIPALSGEKNERKCLYIISKLLQML